MLHIIDSGAVRRGFALVLFALTVGPAAAVRGAQTSAPATAPALTELEQALVENVNLLTELRRAQFEADTCRGALAQPRADATQQQVSRTLERVKARIETDHPGFSWDAGTGAFTPKPHP